MQFALIPILLLFFNTAHAGWLMKCEGSGGEVDFPVTFDKKADIDKTTVTGYAVIKFKQSDAGALVGIFPGECAWLDRTLRPGEPAALCVKTSARKDKNVDQYEPDLKFMAGLRKAKGYVLFNTGENIGKCFVATVAKSQDINQPNPARDGN